MRRPLTPGRLALIGVAVLVLSPVVAFMAGMSGWPMPPDWVWGVPPVVGLLFLGAAVVAKVVQIGVRSAKD